MTMDKLIDQILDELVEEVAGVELRGEYARPEKPTHIDAKDWASDIYGSPDTATIQKVATGLSERSIASSNLGDLYYPTFLGMPSRQKAENFLYALEYARTNSLPVLVKQGLVTAIAAMTFRPGGGKSVASRIIPAQLATDEQGQISPGEQRLFSAVVEVISGMQSEDGRVWDVWSMPALGAHIRQQGEAEETGQDPLSAFADRMQQSAGARKVGSDFADWLQNVVGKLADQKEKGNVDYQTDIVPGFYSQKKRYIQPDPVHALIMDTGEDYVGIFADDPKSGAAFYLMKKRISVPTEKGGTQEMDWRGAIQHMTTFFMNMGYNKPREAMRQYLEGRLDDFPSEIQGAHAHRDSQVLMNIIGQDPIILGSSGGTSMAEIIMALRGKFNPKKFEELYLGMLEGLTEPEVTESVMRRMNIIRALMEQNIQVF